METFKLSKMKISTQDGSELTLKSIVSPSKSQASSELLGETVILELESGVYYGLNETGTLIWNSICESKNLEQIRDIILSEYEIESEQCEKYILNLVKNLADQGLVKIENETIN